MKKINKETRNIPQIKQRFAEEYKTAVENGEVSEIEGT